MEGILPAVEDFVLRGFNRQSLYLILWFILFLSKLKPLKDSSFGSFLIVFVFSSCLARHMETAGSLVSIP